MKALLTGMEGSPDCGGLPRYFHGLVRSLPAAGVSGTALVSSLDPQPSLNGDDPNAFRIIPMAPPGASLVKLWKGALTAAREVFCADTVNLVNVHFALFALWSVRAMPPDMPLVVHFHGPWADELAAERVTRRAGMRSIVARRIELAVYRRATRFITLSHAFANILRDRYRIPDERIRVVPGGADLARFFAAPPRPECRERLGWPTDRPILLSVRRLVRRVGLELLIDAMRDIRKQCPDVLLLIGGKGPLASELQRRVDASSLGDHVRLLGVVPEAQLPLAYAAANWSVVSSVALEGFGLVTVESLGAGTPVLGTPVGGTPETLRDLEPALVMDAPSTPAIADRLIAALRGEVRLPSRQQCRDHAARFDWKQVTPRVREVYDDALGARACSERRDAVISESKVILAS